MSELDCSKYTVRLIDVRGAVVREIQEATYDVVESWVLPNNDDFDSRLIQRNRVFRFVGLAKGTNVLVYQETP